MRVLIYVRHLLEINFYFYGRLHNAARMPSNVSYVIVQTNKQTNKHEVSGHSSQKEISPDWSSLPRSGRYFTRTAACLHFVSRTWCISWITFRFQSAHAVAIERGVWRAQTYMHLYPPACRPATSPLLNKVSTLQSASTNLLSSLFFFPFRSQNQKHKCLLDLVVFLSNACSLELIHWKKQLYTDLLWEKNIILINGANKFESLKSNDRGIFPCCLDFLARQRWHASQPLARPALLGTPAPAFAHSCSVDLYWPTPIYIMSFACSRRGHK